MKGVNIMPKQQKPRIYAMYKGEVNLMDGTLEELSARTGKSMAYLRWMTRPSAKKRQRRNGTFLIRLRGVE